MLLAPDPAGRRPVKLLVTLLVPSSDITAGTFKYGSIVIAAPPNSYSYLDGTGTWRDLTLDSSSNVTSNFTGLRPAGSGANNIWIKFYVGPTAMYIPAWYG
jgi:hypothetical protein